MAGGCCCSVLTTKSLICSNRKRVLIRRTSFEACAPTVDSVNSKVFNMPVIRCWCGAEILLLPDAEATGKAIEHHVQECTLTKRSKNPQKRMETLSRHLIEQVIDIAADEPEEKHSVKTHPV